ncbi:pnas-3 related [Holotrichia oblita]|uniref:Pnas-3 related n=1 Tax=Holotrichia oblita TaxID=644536 RepID=A0ACB9SW34_HOLOL|nr:pnas-3 related [Holotrichia oblita]
MPSNIQIRLATDRVNYTIALNQRVPKIYTPGEIITKQNEFMRGHGTYEENGDLKASVAGVKEEINKLISIRPLKCRYNGETGDVVIGRITEVQQKRWKVDTNSRLDSILLLSSVNLPGGELRRRSAEDEHMMRKYLQEGFPTLIKRSKTRFHNLPVGASIILGNNGYVWISPIMNVEESAVGGFVQNLDEVISKPERETISRLRNCIQALAQCKMMLYDTSVLYAYEESLKYDVKELLIPEAIVDLGILTQERISMLTNVNILIFISPVSVASILILASYIPQCSMKDPDLNKCIKDNANKVIPVIVKGVCICDPDFGIPSLSPIDVKDLTLGGDNLKIVMTDVHCDDVKNIRLTEALFDLKNKKTAYTAVIDSLTVTAKYTVKDGKILSRSVSGSGKYNMTYVGVTIHSKSDVNIIEKDGEKYIQLLNPTFDSDIKRGYFHLENLQSPEGGDLDEFVDKNWEAVWKEIKPSQDKAYAQFLNVPLMAIVDNVPIISTEICIFRGHGTYEENGDLKASVAGVKEEINKLISIRPLKCRYNGETGDARSRRRSAEDEHMMRKYLQEGDLISAEVQNVFSDGSLSLHTRSLKYGKLSQGVLVKVSPTLIKRSKTRFHNLPVGASIILGNNGYVWISPIMNVEESAVGGFVQNLDEVISKPERETISRLRNCIQALAQCKMMLYDTSVLYAYEESLKYDVKELLIPEAIVDLGILTQERISMLTNVNILIFISPVSVASILILASYIPQCSMKDPDLNKCIKDNANKVIPVIVKGVCICDPDFGIPSLSPIDVKDLTLGGDNLKIVMTDVHCDDVKNIRLTEALFDLKNKKTAYTAVIDSLTVTAKYTVKDGKILSRSVSGSGKYNMTYVGVTIHSKSDVNIIEKDGEKYIQLLNPTFDSDIKRGYFHLENLQSPEGGDLDEFVDKNWEAVWKEIKPSQDKAYAQFLNVPLMAIVDNVPIINILIFTFPISVASILILASYIPQCSMKDPDLNKCIKDNANKVIPVIVKGVCICDPDFGIPSLSPIDVKDLTLGGDNLKIVMTDVHFLFFFNRFDLKNKKTAYTAVIDSLTVTAKYTVKDGKILSRSVSGSGKYNMTYVGVTLHQKSDVNIIEKDGEQYIQLLNPTFDSDIKRGYFHLENLQSPEGGDLDEFLDKNWEALWKEIKPSQDKAYAQFLNIPLKAIVDNVPLTEYIKRCDLKDPQLNACLTDHANQAIPFLVKGDPSIGVPVLSPLTIPKLELSGDRFTVILTDVHFDNFKDMVVTESEFDLPNEKYWFVLACKYLNFTADYTLKDGQILSRTLSGDGKVEMSLYENSIRYSAGMVKYPKDGQNYLKTTDPTMTLESQRTYFRFENLWSDDDEGEDINAFLEENWQVVQSKIKPGVEELIKDKITLAMRAVQDNLSIEEAFLGFP